MKKLTILFLFLHCTQLFAQRIPPLERLISIRISNEKIEDALENISKTGNLTFSYSPNVVEINKRVSLNAQNQSVREILNEIFNNSIEYKNRGNYIILKKKNEEERKDFFVMGYVSDGETGLKIEKASIYEPSSLASAVTNQYGFYKIKLSTELNNISLLVRKQDYQGATVSIKTKQDKNLNINLLPVIIQKSITTEISSVAYKPTFKLDTLPNKKLDSIPPIQLPKTVIKDSSIAEAKVIKIDPKQEWEDAKETISEATNDLMSWFLTKKQSIHQNNIQDTIYRNLQISFLPYLGTNHFLSGNVINDYSLNILAGYSLGNRVLEVGLGVNLVRGNVNGIQAAGIANLVGNTTKGIQAAGFMNLNGNVMSGIQAAGTINLNFGNSSGIQAAGFSNLALKNFYGIQAAGAYNMVQGNLRKGVQASGFTNIILGSGRGVQAAGAMNFTLKDFDGVQASGFFNFVGKEFKGVQVGVINYARNANNGVQVGVFNFAKTSNSIPVGLLSFVGNGYKRLEISADELIPFNVTFKTGVKRLYNIISAGYSLDANRKPAYQYSYGLGTAWRLNRTFWLNFDVINGRIQTEHSVIDWETVSNLSRASLGFEAHLSKRFALFVSPTLNFFVSENTKVNLGSLEKLKLMEKTGTWFGNNVNYTSWIGLQGGIRICNR